MLRESYIRFRQEIRIYQAVLSHPRTPRAARWLLGLAIGYALTAIDIIPDFIPVVDHMDDAIIVPGLIMIAVRLIPREVLDECRAEAAP